MPHDPKKQAKFSIYPKLEVYRRMQKIAKQCPTLTIGRQVDFALDNALPFLERQAAFKKEKKP